MVTPAAARPARDRHFAFHVSFAYHTSCEKGEELRRSSPFVSMGQPRSIMLSHWLCAWSRASCTVMAPEAAADRLSPMRSLIML